MYAAYVATVDASGEQITPKRMVLDGSTELSGTVMTHVPTQFGELGRSWQSAIWTTLPDIVRSLGVAKNAKLSLFKAEIPSSPYGFQSPERQFLMIA